ncbi:hypothetical protein B0H14DRAFT_2608671 [Mycena olivaceomarginata]|nr:hypothetical protein B0H14DRAFT_2608671 [Mycena olivaceomarginata]
MANITTSACLASFHALLVAALVNGILLMMRWTCSIAVFAACIASIASLRAESRPHARPAEPAACALTLACVLVPPPVTPWVLAAWALDPACGLTQQHTIVAVGFLPAARNFLYASARTRCTRGRSAGSGCSMPNPFREVQQGSVGLVSRFGQFYKPVDPGLVEVNVCTESPPHRRCENPDQPYWKAERYARLLLPYLVLRTRF